MLGLFSMLLIFIAAPYIQCFYSNNNFRSSYLTIWDDHVLLGHVIAVHNSDGITSCAQGCLSKPGCHSFNFGKDSNLCELNNSSSQLLKHLKDFVLRPGFLHGHWITVPIMQFVFTTLGAQGPTGPKNTSGYLGTTLDGQVKLNNGIQEWTVPYTGAYYIEAFGASGANGTCTSSCSGWMRGGLGAKIAASFELQSGQKLKILVGQKGKVSFDFEQVAGGGGGGTFVTLMDNSPLIVAGGGGGASTSIPGDPGQAGPDGTRHGGTAGSGGMLSDKANVLSGTGAGLWGDGDGMNGKALSFQHGGISVDFSSRGGFGGGGYGMLFPGGGGGYSGGGVEKVKNTGIAGGGGSINNGTSQINESGVNEGDGKVIITLMN